MKKIITTATVADITSLREVFYDRHAGILNAPLGATLPTEAEGGWEVFAAIFVDLWPIYTYEDFDLCDAEVQRLTVYLEGLPTAQVVGYFADLVWLHADARDAFVALVTEFKEANKVNEARLARLLKRCRREGDRV